MAKKHTLPVAKAGGPDSVSNAISAISGPDKISIEDQKRMRQYKAEDALRDIERAEAHKKDAGLMRDVIAMAKEKINSLKKLC
jgi:hypothetical protein